MDPAIYYKTFRPYIRFFENVEYEGRRRWSARFSRLGRALRIQFRGETGAQSSIMPLLVAFMKFASHIDAHRSPSTATPRASRSIARRATPSRPQSSRGA